MDAAAIGKGSPTDLLYPKEVAALFPGVSGEGTCGWRMVYRWISEGKVVRGYRGPAFCLRGTMTPTGIAVQRGDLVLWLADMQRAREAVLAARRKDRAGGHGGPRVGRPVPLHGCSAASRPRAA